MWGQPPRLSAERSSAALEAGLPQADDPMQPIQQADEASAALRSIPPFHAILTPCSPRSRRPARPLIPGRSRCISPQGKAWISSGTTATGRTIRSFICEMPVPVQCAKMSAKSPAAVGAILCQSRQVRCRCSKLRLSLLRPRAWVNTRSNFPGTIITILEYIRGRSYEKSVRVTSARRHALRDNYPQMLTAVE